MSATGSNRMLMVVVNFHSHSRAGGAGTPSGPDLLREILLPQLTGAEEDGRRRPPVSDTDRHDFPALLARHSRSNVRLARSTG